MKIVLASGSPRRRELLSVVGVKDFEVCPAEGEEKTEAGLAPSEIVKSLSAAKAREVAAKFDGDTVIIAADTIVWAEDRVLGKPHGAEFFGRLIGAVRLIADRICIEGIGDAGMLAAVRPLGADCYQGYYFAKPLPVEVAAKLLRHRKPL